MKCLNCNMPWDEVGNQWKRENGKFDYRCTNCGSKRKPTYNKSECYPEQHIIDYDNYVKSCEKNIEEYLSRNTKKLLVLSDLHCGHKSGLTPPEYYVNPHNEKRYNIQKESWEWFFNTIKSIGKVDAVVINGDAIDGKGKRSGGSELITSDLFKQVKIAERCIREIDFDKIFFLYGTAYHVGSDGNDFELDLSEKFNGIIKDHLWLNVNGCTFDIKHKISGSSVLQSRVNALIKDYQWNSEWYKNNGAPQANVYVRSHVHYCNSVTDYNNFFGITTPALQVADTKYGGRQCSGTVDFGFVLFEIPYNYKHISDLKCVVYKKQLESIKSKSIMI